MNIQQKGNTNTNKSDRRGYKPIAIVNHISEGSGASLISWFTSSGNTGSSAHFGVDRDGQIYQFVPIADNAWANGLSGNQYAKATAAIVKEKGAVNPNWYTVSIENVGTTSQHGGVLTDAQFEANVWLTRYIRDYVKKTYNIDIPFDRKHILGHYEIDPVNKPNCPGKLFPWDRLIRVLNDGGSKYSYDDTVDNMIKDGVTTVDNMQAWEKMLDGREPMNPEYVRAIFDRYHAKL